MPIFARYFHGFSPNPEKEEKYLGWTELNTVIHFDVSILHVDIGDGTGQLAQFHTLCTIRERMCD